MKQIAIMQDPSPPRRRAVQARSRATVERILEAAASLVAERGGDGATMTEIAQRAGVVIGSLYQYFPDKAGVMAALFERHSSGVREMLTEAMAGTSSLEDLSSRMETLAERYFAQHRDDPMFRGLWAVVQTDPALQALDVADTLTNADILFQAARPLYRGVDEDRLMAACTLGLQLSVAAARFALAIPAPLGAHAARTYSDMMRGAFLALEDG
jgi:AcrR family transcriptional regulator